MRYILAKLLFSYVKESRNFLSGGAGKADEIKLSGDTWYPKKFFSPYVISLRCFCVALSGDCRLRPMRSFCRQAEPGSYKKERNL